MSCCKKNSCFCLMLTLFRCPLITKNNHLLRDPELSSVTRNCQIYIMSLYTLNIGIYKLKDFMNCIKVKKNNLLNSIYSPSSPGFRFKETPYVNFFTDPELSSSLYCYVNLHSVGIYSFTENRILWFRWWWVVARILPIVLIFKYQLDFVQFKRKKTNRFRVTRAILIKWPIGCE